MTAPEIARRLVSRPVTAVRVRKLHQLCARMGVNPKAVLAYLTESQRQAVRGE